MLQKDQTTSEPTVGPTGPEGSVISTQAHRAPGERALPLPAFRIPVALV